MISKCSVILLLQLTDYGKSRITNLSTMMQGDKEGQETVDE